MQLNRGLNADFSIREESMPKWFPTGKQKVFWAKGERIGRNNPRTYALTQS
jgi:hypothetical protein